MHFGLHQLYIKSYFCVVLEQFLLHIFNGPLYWMFLFLCLLVPVGKANGDCGPKTCYRLFWILVIVYFWLLYAVFHSTVVCEIYFQFIIFAQLQIRLPWKPHGEQRKGSPLFYGI